MCSFNSWKSTFNFKILRKLCWTFRWLFCGKWSPRGESSNKMSQIKLVLNLKLMLPFINLTLTRTNVLVILLSKFNKSYLDLYFFHLELHTVYFVLLVDVMKVIDFLFVQFFYFLHTLLNFFIEIARDPTLMRSIDGYSY